VHLVLAPLRGFCWIYPELDHLLSSRLRGETPLVPRVVGAGIWWRSPRHRAFAAAGAADASPPAAAAFCVRFLARLEQVGGDLWVAASPVVTVLRPPFRRVADARCPEPRTAGHASAPSRVGIRRLACGRPRVAFLPQKKKTGIRGKTEAPYSLFFACRWEEVGRMSDLYSSPPSYSGPEMPPFPFPARPEVDGP